MKSRKRVRYLLSLILLILCLSEAQCYKILIYNPRLGYSHINFFGRIADILVEAGHDVVTYIPELNLDITTNGTKLARIIPGPYFGSPFDVDRMLIHAWNESVVNTIRMLRMFNSYIETQIKSCSVQLSSKASMEQLREEYFDFGITELHSPCGYAVFHKIGLKNYASASATELFEVMADLLGVSSNPSFVPATLSSCGDEMNYWERIQNVFAYIKGAVMSKPLYNVLSNEEVIKHVPSGLDYHMLSQGLLWESYVAKETELTSGIQPAGEDQPADSKILLPFFKRSVQIDDMAYITDLLLREAIAKSSFAFVNSEELLEFPRLISHKIVYIGGIAVGKPKPLNEEYQKIMNESTNGVILVSFGTFAKSSHMPPHIKNSFHEAFRSFPEITFLWKYEANDDYAADLPNVIKKKWVPQLDLLGHPNLRAFVSHCGQNSLAESVHAAVPLICIPLFADQPHNAGVARRRNIGIYINKHDLSPEMLKDALRKILHNDSYRKASQRLLEMIRNKPISARERLLRHVDFALKFGPIDNFNLASSKLSFAQYYLLDIMVPVFLVFALVAYLIFRMGLRFVNRLLLLSKSKKE